MAELVDAPDSGSGDSNIVGVRLSPTALILDTYASLGEGWIAADTLRTSLPSTQDLDALERLGVLEPAARVHPPEERLGLRQSVQEDVDRLASLECLPERPDDAGVNSPVTTSVRAGPAIRCAAVDLATSGSVRAAATATGASASSWPAGGCMRSTRAATPAVAAVTIGLCAARRVIRPRSDWVEPRSVERRKRHQRFKGIGGHFAPSGPLSGAA